MAALKQKMSMGFLVSLTMLILLVLSKVSADVDDDGKPSEFLISSRTFEMGVPLYRVRSKPQVLIPAPDFEDHKENEV